jgi:osmotically-inducible protein OsmY
MRSLLLAIVIVLAAFLGFNYWNRGAVPGSARVTPAPAAGTTGTVDVNAARERGAAVGEKVAIAAAKVQESTREAALTSKIKAKMVLDDTIKARSVDVTTNGSTVTVSGVVRTTEEHDRALRLVRETAGVTTVVDHLRVDARD